MSTSKIFHYRNSSAASSGPRVLGFLLLGAGLLVLLSPWFMHGGSSLQKTFLVGVGAGLIGLLLLTLSSGILLDFEVNRVKWYQNFLGTKFGNWEPMPPIRHAELIHHTFQSKNTPNGITPTMSGQKTVYKCVLRSEKAVFLSLDFAREKDAIQAMEELQQLIGG